MPKYSSEYRRWKKNSTPDTYRRYIQWSAWNNECKINGKNVHDCNAYEHWNQAHYPAYNDNSYTSWRVGYNDSDYDGWKKYSRFRQEYRKYWNDNYRKARETQHKIRKAYDANKHGGKAHANNVLYLN